MTEMNTGTIINLMIQYFGNNIHQINHSLKVYGFAKAIAEGENLDRLSQTIVEYAAVLHDIGIPESIRKYGSSMGHYQEKEGASIGKHLLETANVSKELTERITFIIGNHHSYGTDGGIELQIIFEADFLVNLFEGNLKSANPHDIKNKFFKTPTGIQFIETMYILS